MSELKRYFAPNLTIHGGIAALTLDEGDLEDPPDGKGCNEAPGKVDGELHDACDKQSKS